MEQIAPAVPALLQYGALGILTLVAIAFGWINYRRANSAEEALREIATGTIRANTELTGMIRELRNDLVRMDSRP